jgi:hypothetical protein
MRSFRLPTFVVLVASVGSVGRTWAGQALNVEAQNAKVFIQEINLEEVESQNHVA